MIEFLKQNIVEIITVMAGAGAWGYERKKRHAEIKKYETENNKGIMDLYQEALDDLKKRYDEKFKELEAEIETLRANLNLEKKKYQQLKKAFETYKKS
jgi:ribosomal protein L19E